MKLYLSSNETLGFPEMILGKKADIMLSYAEWHRWHKPKKPMIASRVKRLVQARVNTKGLKVGFTGTQQGMTEAQEGGFRKFLYKSLRNATQFRHGCCIGADAQATTMVYVSNQKTTLVPPRKKTKIICYPSNIEDKTSENAKRLSKVVKKSKPPLERNRTIVNKSDILVATPKEFQEERRSGTWATVRYARKQHKPVVIIWPDGRLEIEGRR